MGRYKACLLLQGTILMAKTVFQHVQAVVSELGTCRMLAYEELSAQSSSHLRHVHTEAVSVRRFSRQAVCAMPS